MQKQAPEEVPPATAAAPGSVGAMNEQGRDVQLISGLDHTAGATSPAPSEPPALGNTFSLAGVHVCAGITQEVSPILSMAFHKQLTCVLRACTSHSFRLL